MKFKDISKVGNEKTSTKRLKSQDKNQSTNSILVFNNFKKTEA